MLQNLPIYVVLLTLPLIFSRSKSYSYSTFLTPNSDFWYYLLNYNSKLLHLHYSLYPIKKYCMRYALLLLLFLPGCMTHSRIDLQQDQTITEHFNKNEVKQLKHILSFFDNQVQALSDTSGSLTNKYHAFFKKILDSAWRGNPYGPILRIPSTKLNNLFSTLSDTIKTELWVTTRYISPGTKDSVEDFNIRTGGKYEAFLKSSSGENPALDKYYNTFKQGNGITPSLIAGFILSSDKLDLNRESQRLIVAIHYIALRETGELRKQSGKPKRKRVRIAS